MEPKYTEEEALAHLRAFKSEGDWPKIETCFRKLGDREMLLFKGMEELKVGKAECEPEDWRRYYDFLASLGLIEYTLTFRHGRGMRFGDPYVSGQVRTTEFGKRVLERMKNKG